MALGGLLAAALAAPAAAQEFGGPAGPQAGAAAGARLHPALRARLAEEPGPAKAWVFFADKGVRTPDERKAALSAVAASYDPRATERRRLRAQNAARGGALFDERDLPVPAEYLAAVRATGARVHVVSRWLNAASVWATRGQAEALAELPCVLRLEPVARTRRIELRDVRELGPGPWPGGAGLRSLDYGAATAQLNQIRLIAVHEAGYTAAGVIVGILDTGFRRTHVAFNNPAHPLVVLAEYDFVDNDPDAGMEPGDPYDQHSHGTMILGCLGAYAPGSLVGGAYDAQFVLCKTEDTTGEYPAEEDNYVAGLEFAESHGADVVTASLGYIDWYTQAQLNGLTAVTTIAVNTATANGVHCCNAAGNEYHDSNPATSHLIAPADAFQVLACGAVDSSGAVAAFSSDGPTADGRVKPELLARGVDTHTVSPSSNTGYTTASGTSLSTPLLACAVACLTQAHPEWTVDQLRSALFLTADYYAAYGTHDPQYVRGYGVVNALAALPDCNGNGVPDGIELASGAAQDCQRNGVLDECELAAGSSADCNANGVPDECDVALPPPVLVADAAAVHGWVELAAVGTPLGIGDDGVKTAPMPFTNLLFNNASVRVGNNGGLGFGGAAVLTYDNHAIPDAGAFGGVTALFPLWDDLDADTGNVYYATIGTPPHRTFVVEWHDRPHYPGDTVLDGDEVTFQVQVFETPVERIAAQFLYLDTDFDNPLYDHGASASVGWQIDGTLGEAWSFNRPGAVGPGLVLSLRSAASGSSADENGNGVPDECESPLGDLNCDGLKNFADIDPFVLALMGAADYYAAYPACDRERADCNGDGFVDFADIDAFVALLGGR